MIEKAITVSLKDDVGQEKAKFQLGDNSKIKIVINDSVAEVDIGDVLKATVWLKQMAGEDK